MSWIKSFSVQISVLGKFWQEKINSTLFRWNIILIALQIGLLFFKFNDLPPQVPLYYSLPWGETQLVSPTALFLLPAFSIIVLLLNNFLAAIYLASLTLLSKLLIAFSLIFASFSLITLFQIINLVS